MRQRVDDVGADAEQTELEHLEQAARTGADDDDSVVMAGCRIEGLALKAKLSGVYGAAL